LRAVDWPPGFDFSVLEPELIPVVTPGFIWLATRTPFDIR
jgi:hypothetical protein